MEMETKFEDLSLIEMCKSIKKLGEKIEKESSTKNAFEFIFQDNFKKNENNNTR